MALDVPRQQLGAQHGGDRRPAGRYLQRLQVCLQCPREHGAPLLGCLHSCLCLLRLSIKSVLLLLLSCRSMTAGNHAHVRCSRCRGTLQVQLHAHCEAMGSACRLKAQGLLTMEGGLALRNVHVASDGTRKLLFGLQVPLLLIVACADTTNCMHACLSQHACAGMQDGQEPLLELPPQEPTLQEEGTCQ